jgi:hypothetical protein
VSSRSSTDWQNASEQHNSQAARIRRNKAIWLIFMGHPVSPFYEIRVIEIKIVATPQMRLKREKSILK